MVRKTIVNLANVSKKGIIKIYRIVWYSISVFTDSTYNWELPFSKLPHAQALVLSCLTTSKLGLRQQTYFILPLLFFKIQLLIYKSLFFE